MGLLTSGIETSNKTRILRIFNCHFEIKSVNFRMAKVSFFTAECRLRNFLAYFKFHALFQTNNPSLLSNIKCHTTAQRASSPLIPKFKFRATNQTGSRPLLPNMKCHAAGQTVSCHLLTYIKRLRCISKGWSPAFYCGCLDCAWRQLLWDLW